LEDSLMWGFFQTLVQTLGQIILNRQSSKDAPTANPRDIATSQSSGYAADRSGKMTSAAEKKKK